MNAHTMPSHHMQAHSTAGHATPAMALVPLSQVTHTAIADGDWSNPATWAGGNVPTAGAHVHIPVGVTVRVASELSEAAKTVRVDGKLSFATDVDTALPVDTLVTSTSGTLEIGTAANPIAADVSAKIIFADNGAIDRSWDPSLISRGALLHGETEIHGAEKTAFVALDGFPLAGDTSITLQAVPTGWQVGDTLVIAGTDPNNPQSDEKVVITAINGNELSFATPLALDHAAPRADLEVHVANLTRNVEFSSENDAALHRGHVMVMHTNDADLNFVSFTDMGRTDKSIPVDDHRFISDTEMSFGPENTVVEDLDGANVRGRYSVHFHRGGTDKDGEAAVVNGAVVEGDVGWAYVNHSSNVIFSNNVSYDVTGAAYNTEAGNEIGAFIGNIAIRTVNPNADPVRPSLLDEHPPLPGEQFTGEETEPDDRAELQDYGFEGDGFWLHGANVDVQNNVVSGTTGHAYIYWSLGLAEKGLGEALTDVANVAGGELIGPDGTMIRSKHVPVKSFEGNDAYAVTKGLQIHYLHTDDRDDDEDQQMIDAGYFAAIPESFETAYERSAFSNSKIWNVKLSGIDAPYGRQLTFDNFDLLGIEEVGSFGARLDHFANDDSLSLTNSNIEGFYYGYTTTPSAANLVSGVTLANNTNDSRVLPIPGDEAGGEDDDLEDNGEEDQDTGEDDQEDEAPEGGEDTGEEGDEEGVEETVIAFVGDSITAEGFPAVLEELGTAEVLDFGVSGAGLTDAEGVAIQQTDAWQELLASGASVVWMMIGVNDIDAGATLQDYLAALRDAVAEIKEALDDPAIYIASTPPFGNFLPQVAADYRSSWVPAIEETAAELGATFVDINGQVTDYPDNYPDGLHPNEAGAETLAALVTEAIPQLTAEPGAGEEEMGEDEGDGEGEADEDGEDEATEFDFSLTQVTLQITLDGTLNIINRADGSEQSLPEAQTLIFQQGVSFFEDGVIELNQFLGMGALSQEEIETLVELYIAYFDRAPDAIGLNFWGTSYANGMSLEEIAALFLDQDETRSEFAQSATALEFAEQVYANVLGRASDAEGLAFWVAQLEQGLVSRATLILEVLKGAKADAGPDASSEFVELQTADQAFLASKVDLGGHFAVTHGLSDVQDATQAMETFERGDLTSFQEAIALIDQEFSAATSEDGAEFVMQIVGVFEPSGEVM